MAPKTPRREALKLLAGAGLATVAGCASAGESSSPPEPVDPAPPTPPSDVSLVLSAMGPIWETTDPFLFCAHHDDRYPAGNASFGPAESLAGRRLGRDFDRRKAWRMYHGRVVPGFPRHPHRGFETVTLVRTGLLDHSDSLGARARYGGGDVQWLTAGGGIMHAEMFPLLAPDAPNPLELFQIWVNLPAADKMTDPHFTMLWANTIPRHAIVDDAGRTTTLTTVAGPWREAAPPSPPPASYASRPEAEVAIWTLDLEPGARFELPAVTQGVERSLYCFDGSGLQVAGQPVPDYHRVQIDGAAAIPVQAGPDGAQLLLLQGRPIGEPVVKKGPFVMNTQAEIEAAYRDYERTRFGGWPFERDDPVNGADPDRFAQRADGSIERPA